MEYASIQIPDANLLSEIRQLIESTKSQVAVTVNSAMTIMYYRRLHCLVAIDLKLGKFEAAYKGQMELYLRWLEKHEMYEGENKL